MKRSVFLGYAALAFAPTMVGAQDDGVTVAYAGSLVNLMEKSIGPAFSSEGSIFHGEAKGSTAIAKLIRDGLRIPDVFVSADIAAIQYLFGGDPARPAARWYATFASTRMQIAYSQMSPHAKLFADAASGKTPWYEVLATPGLRVARTDPAQDPKGYRVLLVLQLAETFYGQPGLSQKILGNQQNPAQILPEESAIARLESGDIDALWVYSVEAASRGYSVIDLPAAIDLSEPRHAADYAKASVTVNGTTYTGTPIVYAVTIPSYAKNPPGGEAFITFFLGPKGRALQKKAGLTPIAPTTGGDLKYIPDGLKTVFADPGVF